MTGKRRPGRPTLYTPDTVKIIVETVGIGGSDADACARAGITPKTFYEWMNTKGEFCAEVTRARMKGKIERINRIRHAGIRGDWKADAWYLERRWPEEYAQQLIIKVTAEQSALLKKYGLTPAQAFEQMIQEFANASTEVNT